MNHRTEDKVFLSLLVGIGLAAMAALIVAASHNQPAKAGVALPSGTAVFETSLQTQISPTDTSMTLVDNSIRGGGSLSGYQCFTLDEGRSDAEFICGTISGTTVSSLERGVSYSNGTTTIAALRHQHRVGANVKISDFPLIQRARNQLNGDESLPNVLYYDDAAAEGPFASTSLASVNLVSRLVNQAQTGFWNVNGLMIYNANSGNVGVGTTSPIAKFSIAGDLQQYGNYVHFGAVPANNDGCRLSTVGCGELWGDDNTAGGGGIEFGIGNRNAGANAYSGLFFNNDLAVSNDSTHYGFIGYTGSHYNDSSFGTAQQVPSLLFMQNTDGPISFFGNPGIKIYNGTSTANLLLSATNAGLNLTGTTTVMGPTVNFTLSSNYLASTTIAVSPTPVPVYQATSTGAMLISDANAPLAEDFLGFALTSGTNGTSILVQTAGVVNGFTGLATGTPYYVQDTAGTIGTSMGSTEMLVGRAVSATSLRIDPMPAMQQMGSTTASTNNGTVSVPPFARTIIISTPVDNGSSVSAAAEMTLNRKGKTTGNLQASNCCSLVSASVSASWNTSTNVLTLTNSNSSQTATVYFFR